MSAPVLAYENLGLVQGSGWLFRGLDLFIGERDRLALIGRNGAGKTTLLKLIAGTIDCDEGRRTIVPGTNVVLLEQEPAMAGHATLLDFTLGGENAPEQHEVEAIAHQIGIDLSREAATASGGERRRAAIARALAMKPDVLLLDEPTSALDIHHQMRVMQLVEELARERAIIVVIVLHDIAQAARYAQRIVVLENGTIAADGAPGAAITPETLARVYRVEARVERCSHGFLQVIVDRAV